MLLFLIIGDEALDLPHNVFGAPATPINWNESFIEGGYVLALCAFTTFFTLRLLKRIKYLEGFLPICGHCKRIRADGEWKPIEDYISSHSAAKFSHGLCPECLEKHYGDLKRTTP
jgi:hypothetical protein